LFTALGKEEHNRQQGQPKKAGDNYIYLFLEYIICALGWLARLQLNY